MTAITLDPRPALVVIDAVTDVSMDAHTNAVTHIFPQLGETATTSEIIGLLTT